MAKIITYPKEYILQTAKIFTSDTSTYELSNYYNALKESINNKMGWNDKIFILFFNMYKKKQQSLAFTNSFINDICSENFVNIIFTEKTSGKKFAKKEKTYVFQFDMRTIAEKYNIKHIGTTPEHLEVFFHNLLKQEKHLLKTEIFDIFLAKQKATTLLIKTKTKIKKD